ncbi:MAG: hypothetical protein BRD27_06430 [Bacteroidetes bacterium QH_10_64_19]|nr:MAG: hypothetical protein BRD27_06430 [Bacteroidetes bacterium QH_10_64_19]
MTPRKSVPPKRPGRKISASRCAPFWKREPLSVRKLLCALCWSTREIGPDIDFRPVVPELLRLYEESTDESLRIMAVNALSAVGGESAMSRLADRIHFEESERVRQQMVRVLTVRLQRQSKGR